MRSALAAVFFASASLVHAADGLPSIPNGTAYGPARKQLISNGWKPVKTPADARGCMGREDTCEDFPEAERCAPTGAGSCSMLWSKNRRKIEIGTMGDNQITVTGVTCMSGC